MARLRAFSGLDMTDLGARIGVPTYANSDLVIVEAGNDSTYYYGNFQFPNYRLEGTIHKVLQYHGRDLEWSVTGLDLDTKFATAGHSGSAYRKAFSGHDVIIGSWVDDRLAGYGRADRLAGKGGDDALNGGGGNDTLTGGSGRDALYGAKGYDVLRGGSNDDRLSGGVGRDTFVFDRSDGHDKVLDFTDRADRIEIVSGASNFRQLEVSQIGDDVRIEFAHTVIDLLDTDIHEIGAHDFLF